MVASEVRDSGGGSRRLASAAPPGRGGAGKRQTRPTQPKRLLPPTRRKVSSAGLHAVEGFEGWRNHPYTDNLGNATIGFGHLLHRGPVTPADVDKWRTITRAQGQRILTRDMANAVNAVKKLVKVPLTQAQFDALVSFTFNIGSAGLADSEALKDLNARHYGRVPADMLHWDHDSAGNVVEGLYNRRKAEGEMFSKGVYPGRGSRSSE
ncbi:MAG TPA: lysozyme [Gaiellaceae bacterium]|nr:lysozyme [Gaiellaceae bacterium]